MMCINAKATPTNDTDYSYHVEVKPYSYIVLTNDVDITTKTHVY